MNTQTSQKRALLIGCGNMGSALLRGWENGLPKIEFGIINPTPLPDEFKTHRYGKNISELSNFAKSADVIILAVKPQIMDAVCAELKPHLTGTTLILSIAAGISINSFENHFTANQPIVRTMPNTPASIGKGITAAVANAHVSEEQKELTNSLLDAAGFIEWVDDEALIDAITALTANGPAYVFYLIETLTKAAEHIGIPTHLCEKLARQTVIGSAALAEHTPETNAATLRKNVTSPGGTTEAALKILMNGELEEIYKHALHAGKEHSKALNT